MKLSFNMNKIKNINALARKMQTKMAMMVIAGVGILILIGWVFMHSKTPEKVEVQEVVKMDGVADSQFSTKSSKHAIEEQQRQIKELKEQLDAVNGVMSVLQKNLEEKNAKESEVADNNKIIQELQGKVIELEIANKKGSTAGFGSEAVGITTTNFSYTDAAQTSAQIKTAKNYVPPGTFVKAVLLNGADTNAGVHGQSDTTPITLRLLDGGTLPNGEHSSLKGCFVTAAAYGDASSERGQIRLQRLSCVRKPKGQILDIPVEGTINDMGGSDGVRGHVVMRNNKLIWNAGISGMLSGFGNAMQQSATTQSISALGFTNAIKSGKNFEYGAYSGANSALSKLADYYIKLADMYHPVIQVHAGSEVNVVFLKGFSLTEGLTLETPSSAEEKKDGKSVTNTSNGVPENLMQTIKDAQLGQGVNVNDGGEV